MFGLSQEELLKSLIVIGSNSCCYSGGDWLTRRCDCKFVDNTREPTDIENLMRPFASEATGCCEIRQAYSIIKNLDSATFEKACILSSIQIT